MPRWSGRDLPWHWSYLISLHKTCEAVLGDPTLRGTKDEPPPKSIWFNKKELDLYRKDREAERKEEARYK